MIPNAIAQNDCPSFFAPLGSTSELRKKYRFTDKSTVGGKVYGTASVGNANGFIYNKAVWKRAGVTDWPTTPGQFIEDLKTIKSRTDAVPFYTVSPGAPRSDGTATSRRYGRLPGAAGPPGDGQLDRTGGMETDMIIST